MQSRGSLITTLAAAGAILGCALAPVAAAQSTTEVDISAGPGGTTAIEGGFGGASFDYGGSCAIGRTCTFTFETVGGTAVEGPLPAGDFPAFERDGTVGDGPGREFFGNKVVVANDDSSVEVTETFTFVGTVTENETGFSVTDSLGGTIVDNDEAQVACSDNVDNDGDGKIDFPFDPGCTSDTDDDETDLEPPTDSDGDGVPNTADNCSGTPNPGQEDFDSDGIGDACDDSGPLPCPQGTSETVTCEARLSGGLSMEGTDADETLIGTKEDDVLTGGGGKDAFKGGSGDDEINSEGQRKEKVNCGSGKDKVKGAKGDEVDDNCEKVKK